MKSGAKSTIGRGYFAPLDKIIYNARLKANGAKQRLLSERDFFNGHIYIKKSKNVILCIFNPKKNTKYIL